MSLEAMPKDLFQLLARELHFVDFVVLLSVSRTVRSKVLACPGAWRAISFALLPVTDHAASCEEWEVDEATAKMVRFLCANDINAFVSVLSFGYKPVSDLVPLVKLHNLRELTVNSKRVQSFLPLCGLRLRAVSLERGGIGLEEFLQSQSELEELSLVDFTVSKSLLAPLGRLRKLRLDRCTVRSLVAAGQAMPGVTDLSLSASRCDNGWSDIGNVWPRLTRLNLCFAVGVTDALMPHLLKLKELEQLNIRMTDVTSAGVNALHGLLKLRLVEHDLRTFEQF